MRRGLPGQAQRSSASARVNAPVVEGLADDRALDPGWTSPRSAPQVGQARRRRRWRRPAGRWRRNRAQQLEVGAGQRAVPADVGDDVAGAALGVEPGQDLEQLAAVRGPAAGGQRGAADVEADRDPVAVPRRWPSRTQSGFSSAAVPMLTRAAAGGERGAAATRRRGCRRTARLDVELADDLGQQVAVAAAAERGVEVDEVDPLGAGLPASAAPPPAGRRTAVSEPASPWTSRTAWPSATSTAGSRCHQRGARLGRRRAVSCEAGQSCDTVEVRGGRPRMNRGWGPQSQLRSSAAPASPDFSGWNWVAAQRAVLDRGDERSPPCSAQVTSGAGCARR